MCSSKQSIHFIEYENILIYEPPMHLHEGEFKLIYKINKLHDKLLPVQLEFPLATVAMLFLLILQFCEAPVTNAGC